MIDEALLDAGEVAGDKWVLLTLASLSDGSKRFGDLIADLTSGRGAIAPNVLIDRLRRMERDGLLGAALYSVRPRRYAYELTESGRELAQILPILGSWAARRAHGKPLRHAVCGGVLQPTMWCPTCATATSTADAQEELHWL